MRILLEIESIIEKKFFFKPNSRINIDLCPEINVGKLFNNVRMEIKGDIEFLKNYDPAIGISAWDIDDFDFALVNEISDFKRYIFFAPLIKKESRDKLKKIFKSKSKDNYDSYHQKFEELGWDYDDHTIVLFGEIKATVIDSRPYDSMLIKKVNGLIELDRDEIIRQCGYIDEEGELDYVDFYHNFCDAIEWQNIYVYTKFFYDIVQKRGNLSTPILSYDETTIIGQDILTVSEFISKVDEVWTEERWEKEKYDDCSTEGPFETGNPHTSSKGYFYGHMSLEEAFDEFSGDIQQSFRPAYSKLCYDNEGDLLNDYLAEHGEHPKELIEFMKNYEDSL